MGKTTYLDWYTSNHIPQVELERNHVPVIKIDAKAIAHLESIGVLITQKAISEIVGRPVGALKSYSRVRALLMQVAGQDRLEQLHTEQANLHEDELVVKLEEAVKLLESHGEAVTQRAVSRLMGLSATALNFYPKLVSRLNGMVSEKRRQSRLLQAKAREDEHKTKTLRLFISKEGYYIHPNWLDTGADNPTTDR